MIQTTESFQPLLWWVITQTGDTLPKSSFNPVKDGEIKYLILHARERYKDKHFYKFYWLEKFIVHDANLVVCDLIENGITGKIGYYDKIKGSLSCYITDKNGVSKTVNFYGDNLALAKCIRYMQELSNVPTWDAYELQLKVQEIQRLKKELAALKEENKRLNEQNATIS
ncbi:hypothetical protein ACFSRY_10030 [Pontibacter locisalis]|uniref:Uncharacterized protein n=1 Tax=Pontibacter locisalis TaxID=1719035 RepID=A0ABW5IQB1_9BACT